MKNKRRKENLFKESLNYIRESKRFIYSIIFIFLAGSLLGFIFSGNLGIIDSFLEKLIKETEGLNSAELMWFIFNNNLSSSFFGLFLGVFLGVFSIFNALTNGVVLGYVYSKVAVVEGYSVFWQLLPHGVFELPAIFISLGLGVKLGMFIFEKNKKAAFIERFKKSLKVFFLIVLPLLLVAAIIEGLLIAFVP